MKEDMKEQLLTKRPIDLLFQLSIPAVIGMIVIGLYPLMDGIFAGKIIGQTAMTCLLYTSDAADDVIDV